MLRLGTPFRRRLHAAGPRGLIRPLGRVDPQIDAARHQCAQRPLVVFEVDNFQHVRVQPLCQLNHVPNHRLARLIRGMRLARINNLQPAEFLRHPHQALRIVKEQVAAFVGRGPARKSQGKDLRTHFFAAAVFHRGQQRALCFGVRRSNLAFRNINGIAQREIVLPPARHCRSNAV